MSTDGAPLAVPHPRSRHELVGHAEAAATLAAAETAGRLHHAWLFTGPAGIGKATLAYRFARFLLAPPGERRGGGDGLGVDPEGRTARQVSAGSHPNLLALERAPVEGDKRVPRTLPIETVRRALTFFQTTAADGGRRICILDSLDEVSTAGANALLKMVEEPPSGGLMLLINHNPQTVLTTVKSRCSRLVFHPLLEEQVSSVLASLRTEELSSEAETGAASLADGSVARALALLDPRRQTILTQTRSLLRRLPALDAAALVALAERLGERRAEDDFALAVEVIVSWLAERSRTSAALGPRRLAPLADVCEKLTSAARTAEIYNLDRRPLVLSMFDDLAEAVRQAA